MSRTIYVEKVHDTGKAVLVEDEDGRKAWLPKFLFNYGEVDADVFEEAHETYECRQEDKEKKRKK